MLWRVVEANPTQQLVDLLLTERIGRAFLEVGVQIVQAQVRASGRFVGRVETVLDQGDETGLGASLGDDESSATCFELNGDEQVGQRCDAPHHFAPRCEAVFFSIRRTVARLIPLNPGSPRTASCKRCTVQRELPAGACEPASAAIRASVSVSYLGGRPVCCTSRRARLRPPSRYAARVRHTVIRPTPSTAMICDSAMCWSKASKMCARLTSRAEQVPLARTASAVFRSAADRRSSVCCMGSTPQR